MTAELRKKLDLLKSKVEQVVSAEAAAQKELKNVRTENKKLQTSLNKLQGQLEAEKNKSITQAIASTQDKAKMIKQINQYIKLIDTSIAQAKGKG